MRMRTFLINLALHLCMLMNWNTIVSAQNTIQDILKLRPDLSTTYALLAGTNCLARLGLRDQRYTFFAPHNSAYQNLSQEVLNRVQRLPSDQLNALFLYHSANGFRRTDMVSASVPVASIATLQDGSPKLFMAFEDKAFINGARFIEKDLDSTSGAVGNGVLHIIDRVFIDMAFLASNAYSYVKNNLSQNTQLQYRTTEFSRFLDVYANYASSGLISAGTSGLTMIDGVINNADMFCTFFVPNDQAMLAIQNSNREMYQSLNIGSPLFLQTVMESHVIPGRVYHSNLLEYMIVSNKSVNAMQGSVKSYWFNKEFYISNNCASAKVIQSNRTVGNGVVFIIDNLLGFIYNDIVTEVLRTRDLSDFSGAIAAAPDSFKQMLTVMAGVSVVPDSSKYTVFAPSSSAAFSSGENDFSQDQGTRVDQLNMHFTMGEMPLRLITNNTYRQTLRSGFNMIFYNIGSVLYVEVDYVRAKILQGNICTKNGIIHIVDKILGVPARTVLQEVSRNTDYLSLYDCVKNTGVEQTLSSSTVTFFAPIEGAFGLMRQSALGNSLLNRQNYQKLKNVSFSMNVQYYNVHLFTVSLVIMRMMIRGYVFFSDIAPNQKVTYQTYFDPITVSNENGDYYVLFGSQKIRVLLPNMRMRNGVIHVVEKVLFDPDNPSSAEWTSSSAVSQLLNKLFLFYTLTISCLCFIISNLFSNHL